MRKNTHLITILLFTLISTLAKANSIDTAMINKMNGSMSTLCYSNPALALDSTRIIASLSKKVGYKKGEAIAYGTSGIIYDMYGVQDSAIYYFDKSGKLLSEIGDVDKYNANQINKASIYLGSGNLYNALKLGTEALDAFKKSNNPKGILMANMVIGTAFGYSDNLTEAINRFKIAHKIADSLGDDNRTALSLTQIATTYTHMQKHDSALYFYRQAEQYYSTEDLYNLINLYTYYAEVFVNLDQQDSAKYYFEKSLELNENFGDSQSVASCYTGLSKVYYAEGDYQKAEAYASKALDIIERFEQVFIEEVLYQSLYKIYLAEDNSKKAGEFFDKYLAIRDSTRAKAIVSKLQEFEFKYNLEKAEKENETLISQNSAIEKVNVQQKIIIALALTLMIIASVMVFNINKQRKKATLSKEALSKLLTIISHDFRSPLTTLKGFIGVAKSGALTPEESTMMFGKLEQNIDNTLDLVENLLLWSKENVNQLEPNFTEFDIEDVIDKNIELYNAAASFKKTTISKNVTGDGNIYADKEMMTTVIRNLLSNAIKFTDGGNITINVTAYEKTITISVTDSGKGMTNEQLAQLFTNPKTERGTKNEKGTGLGLMISYEFVKKHNSTINVTSEVGKGSTFSFTLNLAV